MGKTSASQVAASIRYNAKNTTRVALALNNNTDRSIIEHLESQPNKQGYIKSLIIEDIKKKGGKKNDG